MIAGPHIFVSGQIPADASGKLAEGSIADKTKASCESVKNILEASGSSISRVVKVSFIEPSDTTASLLRNISGCGYSANRVNVEQVTVFLTTMDNFAEMNGVYEKYFTHKPSRSCVAVKELPKGVPVEIECIALSGSG